MPSNFSGIGLLTAAYPIAATSSRLEVLLVVRAPEIQQATAPCLPPPPPPRTAHDVLLYPVVRHTHLFTMLSLPVRHVAAAVFAQGFDAPHINTVVMSRPTLSRPLFMQVRPSMREGSHSIVLVTKPMTV